MDHVSQKRMETMKRKREAEAPSGSPNVRFKPSGPMNGIKHTPQHLNSASLNNASNASTPTHEVRKRPLLSEQLARLLDDKPTSAGCAVPASRPSLQDASLPSPRSLGANMLGASPRSSLHESSNQIKPGTHGASNPRHGVEADSDEEADLSPADPSSDGEISERPVSEKDETEGDTPAAVDMAAPGRPYNRWWGELPWLLCSAAPMSKPLTACLGTYNGPLLATNGALLPEGYQLSTAIANHPWICPIRSCRKVFPKIDKLGCHFVVSSLSVPSHGSASLLTSLAEIA